MTTGMKWVLFLFEIMTIFSALLVTFHPNILYASIALLFTFMGVAVMFLFAGADFIAGVQVVVYVGGVTILILFAIMLTQWLYHLKLRDIRKRLILPLIIMLLGFFPILNAALDELKRVSLKQAIPNLEAFSSLPKTQNIGEALLNSYVLPFEAITILLLGALVGAVWIARPR